MNIMGVYPLTNNGSIVIHDISNADEAVLASINGVDPEWYKIEEAEDGSLGFLFGKMYIPFSEVIACDSL